MGRGRSSNTSPTWNVTDFTRAISYYWIVFLLLDEIKGLQSRITWGAQSSDGPRGIGRERCRPVVLFNLRRICLNLFPTCLDFIVTGGIRALFNPLSLNPAWWYKKRKEALWCGKRWALKSLWNPSNRRHRTVPAHLAFPPQVSLNLAGPLRWWTCVILGEGPEVGTLEDNAALGCEEVMHTVSCYSRDRLKETLIDPENRDACGRNITDPGTDVDQSSRNVVVVKVGRLGEITDLLNTVVPWEPFWCVPVLPDRAQISGGAAGFSSHRGKMHPYGKLPQKKPKKTLVCQAFWRKHVPANQRLTQQAVKCVPNLRVTTESLRQTLSSLCSQTTNTSSSGINSYQSFWRPHHLRNRYR